MLKYLPFISGFIYFIVIGVFMISKETESYPNSQVSSRNNNESMKSEDNGNVTSIENNKNIGNNININNHDDNKTRSGKSNDDITMIIQEALKDHKLLSPDELSDLKILEKTFSIDQNHNEFSSLKRDTNRRKHDSSSIVFPEENPTACAESTLCEDVNYYPNELIQKELQSNDYLKYLQTNDEPTLLTQRIDGAADENLFCASRENVIRPKTGLNKDDKWMFILNTKNFTQAIKVELCQNNNDPCNIIEGFSKGYQTFCKQKFIYRELVAVDTKMNTIKKDLFQIPSSCCCHLKYSDHLSYLRAGFISSEQSTTSKKYN